MSGHGWIVERANGVKARCGGPVLCSDCQKEAADLGLCWKCRQKIGHGLVNGAPCPVCSAPAPAPDAAPLVWHRYPEEKPTKTGTQYLVRHNNPAVGAFYAVSRWTGANWQAEQWITHWAEISGPR